MILSVSIGNTNIRYAVGTKENNRQINLPTKAVCHEKDFTYSLKKEFGSDIWSFIRGSILASVVPAKTPVITDAVYKKTGAFPQRVDFSKLNVDVSNYEGNLGEDRAVACAAALSEYTPPVIVIDLGTATTVNFIDSKGIFRGGAILAGVQTGLNALCENTALLPKINDLTNISVIGNDTQECLVSGAVIGTANILEGYINRIGTDLGGTPTVVVTGGNAPFVLPHCRFDYIYKPALLVEGLMLLGRGYGTYFF